MWSIISFLFVLISLATITNCDKICESQSKLINETFKTKSPISTLSFPDSLKSTVQVSWIGENTKKLIIVFNKYSLLNHIWFVNESNVHLSLDNGKTFSNIDKKLSTSNLVIQSQNGLQRNYYDSNNIFLVDAGGPEFSRLIFTKDGGKNWLKSKLPFILDKEIKPNPQKSQWLLTTSNKNELFLSLDGGLTWKKIKDNVAQFQWTNNPNNTREIVTMNVVKVKKSIRAILHMMLGINKQPTLFKISKSEDNGATWKVIHKDVYGYVIKEKFFYISVSILGNRRKLKVSLDYGNTFKYVYLPTINNEQFYTVLDIEDDMVFVHVNNVKGSGTLFTSDYEGRVFSKSLLNHFYSSWSILSDFYKVKSMRGTYIASQMKADSSLHSMITFNKGAEWIPLRQPENEPCHDKSMTKCNLQISNMFSKLNKVNTHLPLSTKTAVGLILVHGHLADSLKRSEPDVFVSSDGGYNWDRSLIGSHRYQIADHGGLLVAIGSDQHILKFSTDEGRCWHQHKFTDESIKISGILTEPGNKAMTVALWGFHKIKKHWIIYVLDLSLLLDRDCSEADYETWLAHSEMLHPSGEQYKGCLLGKKEKFDRLKKDSLCKNGYSHKINKQEQICPCTKDDYECEYGYYRPVNSMDCIKNKYISENLCIDGVIENIVTKGYKKIPSDVCEGGFTPDKSVQKMINETCNEINDKWRKQQEKPHKIEIPINPSASSLSKSSSSNSVIIIVVCSIISVLVLCSIFFIVRSRSHNIRNHQLNLQSKIMAGLRSVRGNANNSGDRDVLINVDSANQLMDGEDGDAALLTNCAGYESTSPTKINDKKINADSDVEIIG